MSVVRRVLVSAFVVLATSCGSRAAGTTAPSTMSAGPSSTTTAPTRPAAPTRYTAPPIEGSLFVDRVWYPDLAAVVAAVDDIAVVEVTNVGPVAPVSFPGETGRSGISAPTVTLSIEQNVLHPADSAPVRLYDMSGVDRVGREPLVTGSRLLVFLVRVDDPASPVRHGLLDHLIIAPDDTLVAGTPGSVSSADAVRGRGAAFLHGQPLADVVRSIVALRPPA